MKALRLRLVLWLRRLELRLVLGDLARIQTDMRTLIPQFRRRVQTLQAQIRHTENRLRTLI